MTFFAQDTGGWSGFFLQNIKNEYLFCNECTCMPLADGVKYEKTL